MTGETQAHAQGWHKRWQGLLLAAAAYMTATLTAHVLGNTPPWSESAPVEISSDLVASLGLAFAAFQAGRGWSHALVRRSWLLICAGMFLIWLAETAFGKFAVPDYRIIIAAWLGAAILLFRGMQSYATNTILPRIMWSGFAAQMVGHAAWFLKGDVLAVASSGDASLELVTGMGELAALLSYSVAFVTARTSGLDELVAEGNARLRSWVFGLQNAGSIQARRPRICFPFIGQLHQVFHSLPIAVALAQRHPEIDVHVAASATQLTRLRDLVDRKAGVTSLRFDRFHLAWPWRLVGRIGIGFKKRTLGANRFYLAGFDAVVVPERTSTYLRKICPQIRLIGTEHGAGDREITFAPEIALYDFLLLPGLKQARRLLELGYAKPGRYVSGVYAKLDWTLAGKDQVPKLFDNDRITVLYNPHFDRKFSSWPVVGREVLDFFAESTIYNLIFAPHIRMFDPPKVAHYRQFRKYQKLRHMLVDLGSERCADMTYTDSADIYVGDVSSQVVEFITRPRPCLFLNPGKVKWQRDLHYRFWHLGTVVEDLEHFEAALAGATPLSADLELRQREYLSESLGIVVPGQAGPLGAEAIVDFLRSQASLPDRT